MASNNSSYMIPDGMVDITFPYSDYPNLVAVSVQNGTKIKVYWPELWQYEHIKEKTQTATDATTDESTDATTTDAATDAAKSEATRTETNNTLNDYLYSKLAFDADGSYKKWPLSGYNTNLGGTTSNPNTKMHYVYARLDLSTGTALVVFSPEYKKPLQWNRFPVTASVLQAGTYTKDQAKEIAAKIFADANAQVAAENRTKYEGTTVELLSQYLLFANQTNSGDALDETQVATYANSIASGCTDIASIIAKDKASKGLYVGCYATGSDAAGYATLFEQLCEIVHGSEDSGKITISISDGTEIGDIDSVSQIVDTSKEEIDGKNDGVDLAYVWVPLGDPTITETIKKEYIVDSSVPTSRAHCIITCSTVTDSDGKISYSRQLLWFDTGNLGSDQQVVEETNWYQTNSVSKYVNFVRGWVFETFKALTYQFRNSKGVYYSIDSILDGSLEKTSVQNVSDNQTDTSVVTAGWIVKPFYEWLKDKFVRKDNAGDTETMKGSLYSEENITAKGQLKGNTLQVDTTANINDDATANRLKTKNFSTGDITGNGAAVYQDGSENGVVETDILTVRKSAYFRELTIAEVKHIGGELILSQAAGTVARVRGYQRPQSGVDQIVFDTQKIGSEYQNEQSDKTPDYYRLYFDNSANGKTQYNEWRVGDQMRCWSMGDMANKGTSKDVSNSYYWRLVIGVGTDDANGQFYVDVSNSTADINHLDGVNNLVVGPGCDYALQSDDTRKSLCTVPQVNDSVALLGCRDTAYPSRTSAQVYSTAESYSPSRRYYFGITSFSYEGCQVETMEWNATTEFPHWRIGSDKQYIDFSKDGLVIVSPSIKESYNGKTILEQMEEKINNNGFNIHIQDKDASGYPTPNSFDLDAEMDEDTKKLNPISDYVGDYYVANDGIVFMLVSDESKYYWQEVVDKYLITAINKAANAQNTADQAISDNYVTPAEKRSIEKDFSRCMNEYTSIYNRAIDAGIASDNTTLVAYGNGRNQLCGLFSPLGGKLKWLNENDDVTFDTNVFNDVTDVSELTITSFYDDKATKTGMSAINRCFSDYNNTRDAVLSLIDAQTNNKIANTLAQIDNIARDGVINHSDMEDINRVMSQIDASVATMRQQAATYADDELSEKFAVICNHNGDDHTDEEKATGTYDKIKQYIAAKQEELESALDGKTEEEQASITITIDRTEFNGLFTSYYNSESDFNKTLTALQKSDTDNISQKLDDIANDSIITLQEMSVIKDAKLRIEAEYAEYSTVESNYDKYESCVNAWAAYTSAFSLLDTYYSRILSSKDDTNTPCDFVFDTSSFTLDAYHAAITDYSKCETDLLSSWSDAAYSTSNSAKSWSTMTVAEKVSSLVSGSHISYSTDVPFAAQLMLEIQNDRKTVDYAWKQIPTEGQAAYEENYTNYNNAYHKLYNYLSSWSLLTGDMVINTTTKDDVTTAAANYDKYKEAFMTSHSGYINERNEYMTKIGNYVNYQSGGVSFTKANNLVTTGEFAGLFSSQECTWTDGDGIVHEKITAEAFMKTSIENGISKAEIKASQINMTGATTINGILRRGLCTIITDEEKKDDIFYVDNVIKNESANPILHSWYIYNNTNGGVSYTPKEVVYNSTFPVLQLNAIGNLTVIPAGVAGYDDTQTESTVNIVLPSYAGNALGLAHSSTEIGGNSWMEYLVQNYMMYWWDNKYNDGQIYKEYKENKTEYYYYNNEKFVKYLSALKGQLVNQARQWEGTSITIITYSPLRIFGGMKYMRIDYDTDEVDTKVSSVVTSYYLEEANATCKGENYDTNRWLKPIDIPASECGYLVQLDCVYHNARYDKEGSDYKEITGESIEWKVRATEMLSNNLYVQGSKTIDFENYTIDSDL